MSSAGLRPDDLLSLTDDGLYCAAGGFHIDPWRPVNRAVITHAHSDHACRGSTSCLASPDGAPPLRLRLDADTTVESLAYGVEERIGDVFVSLHPAGHILGSAQVRLRPARGGPTWVVSGDYKTRPDRTCQPFEPVACDVFLTESTFGLPVFRWRDDEEVAAAMRAWCRENADAGRTSLLLAYSLGKAQRVLAALGDEIGPIGVHGAVGSMCAVYEEAGVRLPPFVHANASTASDLKGRGVIVAPPSAMGTSWLRKFNGPEGTRSAMVSGWMRIRGRRRWRATDQGFVLSDHADWPGLLEAIGATGATRVGVTHGYAAPLARHLAEQGRDTFVLPTRFRGEDDAADGAGEAAEPGEVA